MRLSEKPPLKSQRILLQFQLPIKLWLLSADVSHAIAKALNCDATALTALAITNGKPAEGYEVSLRQVDNGRLPASLRVSFLRNGNLRGFPVYGLSLQGCR